MLRLTFTFTRGCHNAPYHSPW